jgi:uncharacterized membrane protein YeaQ/YmgE (transglycosylase-associated protein family)
MGIVSWALAGLAAGFLTGKFLKNSGSALIGNIITGLIGGLIGGYLSTTALSISEGLTRISVIAMIISFVVAIFIIVIARLVGESRDKALGQ